MDASDRRNVTHERHNPASRAAVRAAGRRYAIMLKGALAALSLGLLVGGAVAAPSGTAIGQVDFVRGVGSIQRAGKTPVILGKGAELEEGDIVTTSPDSFAVLKLTDGTRMTVRPETQMVMTTYRFKQPASTEESGSVGSMVFNLLRGGLRTVTGLIPKRDINAARIVSPTATVGIRGTDFDVRICGADCGREETSARAAGTSERNTSIAASARVVKLEGSATATAANGARRLLAQGGPIYPGDTLETDSSGFAVLVFRDNSRITLQPSSRVQVADFVYDADHPGDGRFFVSLFKGGLRAFTGLVGKFNHANVRVNTPSATVGIRGTGFDAECQDDACTSTRATVWDGSIDLAGVTATASAAVNLGTGDSGVAGAGGAQAGAQPLQFKTPRPDGIEADIRKLFGVTQTNGEEPGLYVLVRDGHVSIVTADQILDLGKNEVGFSNGNVVYRPLSVPTFLDADKIPLPGSTTLAQNLLGQIQSPAAKAQCKH